MSVNDELIHSENHGSRFAGKIPVRNLWFLMLYASDLFREQNRRKVAIEEVPDEIPDLVAEILCRRVEDRLLRTLNRDYQLKHEILSRVRGRINQFETLRKRLLDRARISCSYQNLTVDTVRNRYVKAALEKVRPLLTSDDLQQRCRRLALQLRQLGVGEFELSEARGAIPSFGYLDRLDRQMVEAARLVFEMSFPTEDVGTRYLSEPDRQITWLRKLFEKGVGGFYKTVLQVNDWKVTTGEKLEWAIDDHSSKIAVECFPSMYTDIILESLKRPHRIVIDTKFNSLFATGRYREKSFRSGYVYQIYAYLRSQEGQGKASTNTATGILLHPSVDCNFDEFVAIQKHKIRFVTVDLAASTLEIRSRLLNIITSET